MSKLSKTARASLGQRGAKGSARLCPKCGEELVATKVMRVAGVSSGGMFWVCQKDDFRAPIGRV
ncbi:MAG TPA: hypothetical protein VLV83_03100 [Acidobacteriota bacterium]|nr:hypothetical protein [Acidobacteriota bacterium]